MTASGSAAEAAPAAAAPSPWRDRRFRVFAVGNGVNNVGEAVYKVALPLLVYDLTGSLAAMSVLAVLNPVTLLLGPLLGAVVDRWGPRVFVVPGLVLQLVAAVALNVVGLAEGASLVSLFALGALVQLGGAAYRAGWMAGVATMFPANAVRARGALSSLFVASNIVGPLLVALTLPHVGYFALLWVNVATFVAPVLVWWAGVHPPRAAARPPGPRPSLLADIAVGWRIVVADPRVVHLKLVGLPLHFVSTVGTLTLAVYALREDWGMSAAAVSAVLVATNVSALAGTLAVSERREFRARPLMAVSAVGMAGCLLLMAVPLLPVLLAALVVFFGLRAVMAVTSELIIYRYLPAEVVGRAAGLLGLLDGVPIIAAPFVITLLEPAAGAGGTFAALGLVALLAVGHLVRSWARWSAHDPAPAAGSTVREDQSCDR